MRDMARELREAHCDYCGRPACSPIVDLLAPTTVAEKRKYICRTCVPEYHRFLQQQLLKDWTGVSREDEMAAIREIVDAVDGHMREWVSSGGSGEDV